MKDSIVSVWLFAGFEKDLHYKVPSAMAEKLSVGSLVRVPVGRRHVVGVVNAVDCEPDLPLSKLKAVSQVINQEPALTPPLLELCSWIQSYYGGSRESVLETMIPAPARQGMSPKRETYVSLAKQLDAEELEALRKRAPKQAQLYELLAQQFGPQKKSVLTNRLSLAASTYTSLRDKGLIAEESVVAQRVAYDDELGQMEYAEEAEITLNEEQQAAVKSVEASRQKGKFATHLLQGVTGSGKTEVYLQIMEKALEEGKSVLFLVPEVALAPQTVGRLRSRLARFAESQVVVWHSHLSDGERMDAWMACASGAARVVVGARSAVFAPLQNLGLVVVDEEHEPAYKQDETPRYHGRDVAIYRSMLEGATCILGSATPSLESYRNAKAGKYHLDRLTQRVDDRQLPMMHIVDMRAEVMRTRKSVTLSNLLVEKLRERFENGEQSILFINRRGFSASMICQECGYVPQCSRCSVTMTYHRSDETLKCHLCGYEEEAPLRCPECGDPKIRWRGLGTQRIEGAVKKIMPRARVVRVDSDTMSRKHLFREIFGNFRSGKIDVLVGTQMIGKGLDFPNVTLVGLVDADLSLHIPDFRANERTFQLLVQVSGRAGRGDLAGEVVAQTFTPHAEAIQFARRADVDTFLEFELQAREQHGYPPARHLLRHIFRGPNVDKVAFFAAQFSKRVQEKLGGRVEMRGPTPCSIEKIKSHYRFQIWYFAQNVSGIVAELRKIEESINWPKDVIPVLDVDALSLS